MQNKSSHLRFILFIVSLIAFSARADTFIDKGFREFEELRLRQLHSVQQSGEITPFTTDGCSGGQSQNWEQLANLLPGFERQFGDKPPWEDCCVDHDKKYWRGNAIDGYIKRKQADEALRRCVVETGKKMSSEFSVKYSVPEEEILKAFNVTADLMYQAVRLGGQPCSLLPWRWGYGWDNCAFATINDSVEPYSDVKKDENITFFNATGWLDKDNKNWNIPIHAWIYEPQNSAARKGLFAELLESIYGLKVTPDTESNFRTRTNLIIAGNKEEKTLVIRIAGQDIVLPKSQENGHVSTTLKLPVDTVNAFSDNGYLHYFLVTGSDDGRQFRGKIRLVYPHGISIISDIDDTIKITNVTDHKRLFEHTFFKDFQEVEGMPQLYQQLADHNTSIHFVSSSPWQLYGPLNEFIQKVHFPWAEMNLKYVRFKDETVLNLFKKGTETKPIQIEPILRRYPDRQFILIGDSGEQDPEVYGDIARRYPKQIYLILIRNVDNSTSENDRYQAAFRNVARSKWTLFDQPYQLRVNDLLSSQ